MILEQVPSGKRRSMDVCTSHAGGENLEESVVREPGVVIPAIWSSPSALIVAHLGAVEISNLASI